MALTELINKKRGEINKTPIDHGSMKTHLILKANIAHPGAFDFESPELKLDADRIAILQEMLNEQFGIYLEKLSSHCTHHPAMKVEKKPTPVPEPVARDTETQSEGIMSKLGRVFGR
jgi:hypothetical protein